MSTVFKPVITLMNRLSYKAKFSLLGVLFMLPTLVLGFMFLQDNYADIQFVETEFKGLKMVTPMRHLVDNLQKHRGMTSVYLKGNHSFKEKMVTKEADLSEDIQSLDKLMEENGQQFQVLEQWQAFKKDYQGLIEKEYSITAVESVKLHTSLIKNGLAMLYGIGSSSNLLLDPEQNSFLLIDQLINKLLPMTEKMGIARAKSAALANGGPLSVTDRGTFYSLHSGIEELQFSTETNLEVIYRSSPNLKEQFTPLFENIKNGNTKFLGMIKTYFIDAPDTKGITSEELFSTATAAIDDVYKLYDQETTITQQLLETRHNNSTLKVAVSSIVIIGAAIFLTYVFIGLYMAIMSTIGNLVQASDELAKGNLCARVKVDTTDELSKVAQAFNDMAISFNNLIGTIKQNASSVASASEELSATSSQMKSTAEQLTGMSTSASQLVSQLDQNMNSVAAEVQQSSNNIQSVLLSTETVSKGNNSVEESTREMTGNIQTLASAAEEMSTTVNTVAAAIEEMTASLNEVSKNAAQGADASAKAEQSAANTRKTIDTLGQSAREISSVLEVIKSIASQTNLLALNATIEAASAGEAGKGFAVVANEVKELAHRSAEAAEDIRRRIEDMQHNTEASVHAITSISEVISQMNLINNSIAGAVEEQTATISEISQNIAGAARAATDVSSNIQSSSRVAIHVAEQMQESNKNVLHIAHSMEELAKGSAEITRSTTEAAQGTNDMANNVEKLNQATKETEQGAGNLSQTAQELSQLASSLEHVVSQFQIAS